MARRSADRQHGLRAHGGEQRRDAAPRRMRAAPRWHSGALIEEEGWRGVKVTLGLALCPVETCQLVPCLSRERGALQAQSWSMASRLVAFGDDMAWFVASVELRLGGVWTRPPPRNIAHRMRWRARRGVCIDGRCLTISTTDLQAKLALDDSLFEVDVVDRLPPAPKTRS